MAKEKEPDYVKLAQKRVKKVKDFMAHFYSWVIVGLFLVFLNLLTSPEFLWALMPIFGWGIGLAFHAFDVFGYPGFGKGWEERALEREAEKLRSQAKRLGLPVAEKKEEEELLDLPELKKEKDAQYRDDELV